MPDQDDVCRRGLVGLEPLAEVIAGNINSLVRLIARVDLAVDDVGFDERVGEEVMDMSGKRPERRIIAHKAVDVDNQQRSPAVVE